MEIALGIIGAIIVVLVVILALAAGKSDELVVKRTRHLDAAPGRVFELINDFKHWTKWSPWEELDPSMQRSHSGNTSGVGAIYEWSGNKKVGKGRMEITESEDPERVVIALHFITPWEAQNITTFTLKAVNESTEVEWRMDGKRPLMMKVMSLFMNLDDMVGKDFEKGLSKMKVVAETSEA